MLRLASIIPLAVAQRPQNLSVAPREAVKPLGLFSPMFSSPVFDSIEPVRPRSRLGLSITVGRVMQRPSFQQDVSTQLPLSEVAAGVGEVQCCFRVSAIQE